MTEWLNSDSKLYSANKVVSLFIIALSLFWKHTAANTNTYLCWWTVHMQIESNQNGDLICFLLEMALEGSLLVFLAKLLCDQHESEMASGA